MLSTVSILNGSLFAKRQNSKKRLDADVSATLEQEKTCFSAIIRGLQKYDDEGSNEFRDWVPDDIYDTIENEFYEWSQEYPEVDIEQLKEKFGIHSISFEQF